MYDCKKHYLNKKRFELKVLLTYLNDSTIAAMMPVTNTTIPSTAKKPVYLVKSTYKNTEKLNTSSQSLEVKMVYILNVTLP